MKDPSIAVIQVLFFMIIHSSFSIDGFLYAIIVITSMQSPSPDVQMEVASPEFLMKKGARVTSKLLNSEACSTRNRMVPLP